MRVSFDGSRSWWGLGELLDARRALPLSGGSDELQGAGLLGSVVERAGEALAARAQRAQASRRTPRSR